MGIAHTSGAPDGWLGRRGAGFEGKLPRRIVAVGDQFRYECGLRDRFRNRDRLRKRSCESHGRLAVTGNPTQGASIADVIVSLERQTIGAFTGPVCVRKPVRMLMRWIAIMDMHERSLGEGQKEASGYAKMQCPTHVLLSYRVVRIWIRADRSRSALEEVYVCWTSASDFENTKATAKMPGEVDGQNGLTQAQTKRGGSSVLPPVLQAEVQVL